MARPLTQYWKTTKINKSEQKKTESRFHPSHTPPESHPWHSPIQSPPRSLSHHSHCKRHINDKSGVITGVTTFKPLKHTHRHRSKTRVIWRQCLKHLCRKMLSNSFLHSSYLALNYNIYIKRRGWSYNRRSHKNFCYTFTMVKWQD